MKTMWDNPTGCVRPSQLRVGDTLQIKPKERLFQVFGDDWEESVEGNEEASLDYLVPEDCKPLDKLVIKEIREQLRDENRHSPCSYIPVIFEGFKREWWFVIEGDDPWSDNITFNEMFDVVEGEYVKNNLG